MLTDEGTYFSSQNPLWGWYPLAEVSVRLDSATSLAGATRQGPLEVMPLLEEGGEAGLPVVQSSTNRPDDRLGAMTPRGRSSWSRHRLTPGRASWDFLLPTAVVLLY